MKHCPIAEATHVTCAEIEVGLRTAARLVRRYGDQYLPYFLYLEKELAAAQERDAVTTRINALLAK